MINDGQNFLSTHWQLTTFPGLAVVLVGLGLSLIVDTVDGPIARRVRVAELLPRWSGDVLDLVVDFLTYVFVPAFAIAAGGFWPEPGGVLAGMLIVTTGVLYFADRRMKSDDNHFRGFPGLWNIAAFYLFLLHPPPALASLLVAVLIALTFVPFHVIHPMRIAHLRAVTTVALAGWAILAILAVVQNLDPATWTVAALCLLALYFVVIGFLRRHRP